MARGSTHETIHDAIGDEKMKASRNHDPQNRGRSPNCGGERPCLRDESYRYGESHGRDESYRYGESHHDDGGCAQRTGPACWAVFPPRHDDGAFAPRE